VTTRELALQLAATLRARALFQGERLFRAPRPTPEDSLDQVAAEVGACTLCRLCETRTRVVVGEGDPKARLMFVGEAPGYDEDQQGRPFVGKSGQLLTRMIEAGMGLPRESVYIANVLKCRPPDNRDPMADEAERCHPYLLRQIAQIEPEVICTLGRHALTALTGYTGGLGRVRGRPMRFEGRIVIPTYHPAFLLRNPAAKRDAWEDLKAILRTLGLPVPDPRRPSAGA